MIESVQGGHIVRHSPFMVAVAAWLMLCLTPLFNSEIARVVVAVGCIVLMVFQWLTYRRASRGTHFAFLSLVVAGFGLANLWLMLNVARFYTYDAESGSKTHICIIHTQNALVWMIVALAAVVSVWGMFYVVHWVSKRIVVARR